LQAVGINKVVSHVSRFGFNPTQLPHNLSLALGTGTVTPYELAAAYTVFANGGFRVVPFFIDHIESDIGERLMEHRPLSVCQECFGPRASNLEVIEPIDAGNATDAQHAPRVLDAQNAWVTNSMLQDVIRIGTARAARSLQRQDLAGKTGTTNEQKDAWFTGFNGNIVTTTWVGFDQSTPLGKGETGARAALPMWIKFMRVALAGMPETFMPEPTGLVKVRIDADSGLLTNAENPNAIFESFPVNSVPVRESPLIEYSDDSEGRSSNEVSEDLF
jgi:penicillin-binding protein 1A